MYAMARTQDVCFICLLITGLSLCSAVQSGVENVTTAKATPVLRGTSRHISPTLSGTATKRLEAARGQARSLNQAALTGDWEGIRKQLLQAAGLKAQGETSHCFNDYNHVSAMTVVNENRDNEHDGKVTGMGVGNQLGDGIKKASLHDRAGFEKGGSWCTCAIGAGKEPPFDVAHHQFKSEVAFYLVWLKGSTEFALVTEEGKHLACGQAEGTLPPADQRKDNWDIFAPDGHEGKIAKAALECDAHSASLAASEKPGKSAGQRSSSLALLGMLACLGSFLLAR